MKPTAPPPTTWAISGLPVPRCLALIPGKNDSKEGCYSGKEVPHTCCSGSSLKRILSLAVPAYNHDGCGQQGRTPDTSSATSDCAGTKADGSTEGDRKAESENRRHHLRLSFWPMRKHSSPSEHSPPLAHMTNPSPCSCRRSRSSLQAGPRDSNSSTRDSTNSAASNAAGGSTSDSGGRSHTFNL